ncbi:hypothetical protein [Salinibacter altiplanensis]|uniref:hypothetical protein n=1 Tax=Salinibacter altiplanensis TaxID=1803181 RepID=UPI000C9F7C5A|nr:hypothetical protein [Salinibacter altiplanensis]
MISPDPRNDKSQQRRVAAFMTMGVVALAALFVGVVSVPDFTSPQEQFRKLDPQRFADLDMNSEPEPEQESESESESQEEENPEEAEQDAEPEKAPERVEAPDLSSDGLNVDPSPSETPNETSRNPDQSETSGGNASVAVERNEVGEAGGAQTFDDPSTAALPSGESGSATSGSEGTDIALAEGSGSGEGDASGDDFGGGGEVAAGSEGQAGGESGSSVEVSLKDVSQEDYGNLEVNKLIQWMKNHPAELPPGVQQLVQYRADHLSSKLRSIEAEGERYELYLMCKESLKEVHIVLVKDKRAQYLVDRSFQKQSRKFRAGPVRRSEDSIVGVRTEGRPRGKEAERFYDVFLSWWKRAKKDVE